jgi:hypothetical protein
MMATTSHIKSNCKGEKQMNNNNNTTYTINFYGIVDFFSRQVQYLTRTGIVADNEIDAAIKLNRDPNFLVVQIDNIVRTTRVQA